MFLDIQGLRCAAVIAVVLFHIWPSNFATGYLGVDIFFVISGYLMHHILNSKEITVPNIGQFYFRRIDRIVPEYLFVLFLIISAVVATFSSTDLRDVMKELLAAATFTSNTFSLPKTGYFDVNNQFPPFLHTWSLSTELQFYLLVPLIFLIYRRIGNARDCLGTAFITLLLAVSLFFQVFMRNDTNLSHMNLLSRIWQFMVGFLVNSYHNEKKNTQQEYSPILSMPQNDISMVKTTPTEFDENTTSWLREDIIEQLNLKNLIALVLLVQLTIPISNILWIDRIISTFTAAFFIYLRDNSFFESSWMVYIGGISYSIYLIHWPVIIIYKYLNVETNKGISLASGILIIQTCIFLSALIEKTFKHVREFTTNTAKLSLVILLIYAGITGVFFLSPQPTEQSRQLGIPIENYEEFIFYAMEVFDNREGLRMKQEDLIEFNKKISDFSYIFSRNQRKKKDKNDFSRVFYQVEGTGELEIVLIGNSIAGDLYFGLWGRLKHKFRRLTLYFVTAIVPFRADEFGDHPTEFLNWLEKFDRPIDILIVRNTHHRIRHEKEYIVDGMKKDLDHFYGNISSMSPKNIFISLTEYESGFNHQQFMNMLQQKKKNGFKKFNFSFKQTETSNLELDEKLMDINCPKCHFVDLYRRLCDPTDDSCVVVDEHGVANYKDGHHSTLFGSFYFADELIISMERHGVL